MTGRRALAFGLRKWLAVRSLPRVAGEEQKRASECVFTLARRGRRALKTGFSVIEALVAIAVASIGLIAVFALQRQLIDGQRRYEHAIQRSEARRNVLALLRDLNPVDQPEGRMELPPNARLVWTTTPLNDFKRTTGLPIGDGVYEVRLYTVQARLTDLADRPRETLSFDRLGWRRIGGPMQPGAIGF